MPARTLVLAIFLLVAPAAFAGSVDWSQYVEKPGTKYTTSRPDPKPAAATEEPAAKPEKAEKAKPTKVAKKAAKPAKKAPAKARRKQR